MEEKVANMSFQCYVETLFNNFTPGLYNFLGECTYVWLCYLLLCQNSDNIQLLTNMYVLSDRRDNSDDYGLIDL